MSAVHACDVNGGITLRLRPSLKKTRLTGQSKHAKRICPFTLEPIEACSARKAAYKQVCSLTLESCSYVPAGPIRRRHSNSVFS